MQIHELNNFSGTLGAGSYLAIDNGTDTGRISSQGLLASTEARIDAANDQITDVKSDFAASKVFYSEFSTSDQYQQGVWGASTGGYDSAHSNSICTIDYLPSLAEIIQCSSSFKMRLQAWEGNTYRGVWNGTGFQLSNPSYFKTKFNLFALLKQYSAYKFKIVLFASDGVSNVSPSDAENIELLYSEIDDLSLAASHSESNFCGLAEFKSNVVSADFINLIDFDGIFKDGYLVGSTGKFTLGASGSGLDCCTDFIKVKGSTLVFQNSVTTKFNLIQYDSAKSRLAGAYYETASQTFTLESGTEYVRLSFVSSVTGFSNALLYEPDSIPNILAQKIRWRNGTVNNTGNATAVSFETIIPNCHATSVSLLVNIPLTTGHKYRYQITTFSVDKGKPESNSSNRITIEDTVISENNFVTFDLVDGSVGFAFALFERDEDDVAVPLRITTFDTNKVYIIRHYDERKLGYADYAIGANFIKTPIKLKLLGTLSALQSFCKYDSKYYSTDGETLYEQSNAFSLISSTALSLGHGNAMQLGSNGIAYVSGWNDQKVYAVDLSSKSIVSTITLPTSGYTTCAVDDINGLVYIFQRDSTPSTEEHYNFIVYDYVNGSIVSRKKTSKAFGAMQACDFVDGKIFVLNGLGTLSVPNGYRIYNTNGDVIGEYVLGTFETMEPEGIFVDRDTFNVMVSYNNKGVYALKQWM